MVLREEGTLIQVVEERQSVVRPLPLRSVCCARSSARDQHYDMPQAYITRDWRSAPEMWVGVVLKAVCDNSCGRGGQACTTTGALRSHHAMSGVDVQRQCPLLPYDHGGSGREGQVLQVRATLKAQGRRGGRR